MTKEFSSPAHFLSTSQASGLSLLGQMACEQEFQTNFNIQSNIIGIINLKKKNNALKPISIGSCHFLIPPAQKSSAVSRRSHRGWLTGSVSVAAVDESVAAARGDVLKRSWTHWLAVGS